MRSNALIAAAALAGASGLSPFAAAASIEASTLATVTVDAPLYDTNLGVANGCDPAGCVGDLTRDGDATTLESRWSCKPALGAAGSTCLIKYALSDELTLNALNIALFKGNTRTRTMDILVDGQKIVTWTSSGTTAGFETVELGVTGQNIELQGVLANSEWLSIMEVEILADDGETSAVAVEAGELGAVTSTSDLYDKRFAAANGCDPQGCTAALTRDGDLTDSSRWSCAPSLGGACSISYDLGAVRELSELKLALYKGATRVRTVEVYVDGTIVTTWTSSGTTAGFESVDLSGTSGSTIEIVGVLADKEWLSIIETEIMVLLDATPPPPSPTTPIPTPAPGTLAPVAGTPAPGTLAPVAGTPAPVAGTLAPVAGTPAPAPTTGTEEEAGDVGTVTTASDLYDTNLSGDGGCDPAGCTADLTRDGDLTEGSRWSCAPKLGGQCSISYDLGAVRDLSQLRLALYKGAIRVRTVEVYVDGTLATTWTSSGTTAGFESIDLSRTSGSMIEIVGVLADNEWLSIIETEIMVLSDVNPPPPSPTTPIPTPAPIAGTPAPVAGTPAPTAGTPAPTAGTPAPAPTTGTEREAGDVGTVTPASDLYDTNRSGDEGCDPAGCTADLTRDGDLTDGSRWSCAPKLGGQCSISYDLGAVRDLSQLRLALYKGATRARTVEVYVDGTLVTTWTSSGTTVGFESIDLSGTSGSMIEIVGVLGDSEWLSIIETEIMVWPAGPTMAPAPTATAAPTPPSPTPGAVLRTVGLLPLARGQEPAVDRFAAKDGDLGTSWTCTGDPREPTDGGYIYYECDLSFGLVYYRNIKQVKIALADGADRAVDMRISGRYNSDLDEKFVTSSGTTTGLETYEFDSKTASISIAAIFSGPQQSITISEVEFVEEVVEGEALIDVFNTPYDNGDGLWNEPTSSGFEWSSDSDEAIGRTLYLGLAGFFTVSEMHLMFPVGDTYKFDLQIYSGLADDDDDTVTVTDLESENVAGWQSFDLTDYSTQFVTGMSIVMKGRGSGAPGFALLDANIMGTQTEDPTDTVYVGSTMIEYWEGDAYPNFVAEGTGDQHAINAAICAVKKADYDGADCVGGDNTATGTVVLSFGAWFVDGSIVMKSGVLLKGWYSIDDSPNTTDIQLEESAAADTDMEAIVVMDGISDAWIEDLWLRGQYDPEADGNIPGPGFGPACLSVTNSQNITCEDIEIRFCDGDAMVVRDSQIVNIDAGDYDDEYLPWTIGRSRGTGLIVDTSDSVWVRRHTLYDNGVAGIHIMGSNNFTFEATAENYEDEGEGNVGSLDGQQPIEIIIENSSLLKFEQMRVRSLNDPVMTISESTAVSFTRCGFSNVETGTCVIQTDDPSTVAIDADEDELNLVGTCYVKV
eukprot:g18782.t1